MQTKNLTIMFTDMKGFTERTSAGSRQQVEHLLDVHDNLIRPIFTQFGGRVVKTIGDAFLVVFESPTDAVLCGIRIQKAVADHKTKADAYDRFEIRIAINSGEVHVKDNDVFGEPVNIAARIQAIAEPNEVYFTESVYLTMNKNEIPSSEVGQRHLKGIPEQIKVYKVLQEGSAQVETRPLLTPHQTDPTIASAAGPRRTWVLVIVTLAIVALLVGAFLFVRQRTVQKKRQNLQNLPLRTQELLKEPLKKQNLP